MSLEDVMIKPYNHPMKKFLALFLVLPVFVFSISAESVYSTEHFDFIYSEETEESAAEIAAVAEDYYSKLVSLFGTDPELHIPVYFKSDIKSYNAYFTNYPSNHIVIFVTSIPVSLFKNASKPLSLTFLHELTHAFTNNIRSPFFSSLSSVFGDFIAPGNLYLNKGFIEGIAVYTESRTGEGRLNDAFSLYLVNQMAAEKKDLHYLDISGARDITPGGNMSYILGASFLEYLSSFYGEDKVTSFIRRCYEFPLSTTEIIFREIFGLKLSDAWRSYLESASFDYEYKSPDYASEWGGWRNLTLSDGEIYVEDSYKSGLFKVTESGVERVMLTSSSMDDFSVSLSYYLLPYVTSDSRCVNIVRKDGSTYRSFSDYYTGLLLSDEKVLLLTEEDRTARLDLYSLTNNEFLQSYNLGRDVTLSSGIALNGDSALFLMVRDGRTELLLVNLESGKLGVITLSDSVLLSSLALSFDGSIAFSYVERNNTKSFAKYGELWREGDGWYFALSEDEYSGGIYSPVKNEEKVYFISSLFDGKKISFLDYSSLTFSSPCEAEESDFVIGEEEKSVLEGESYNPFKYMRKGILLPIGEGSGVTLGPLSGLGLSYLIADPTEAHTIRSSFGYSFENKAAFIFLSYSYKTYFTSSFFSLYRDGRTDTEADFTFSYKKTLNSDNRFIMAEDTVSLAYTGYSGKITNVLSLYYQDAYKMGRGRYEILGWGGKAELKDLTPSISLSLYVPHILPSVYDNSMCYSVPFSLTFAVTDYRKPTLEANGTFYLFTYEVQRSVRFLRLYLRNIDLIFTYDGSLRTEDMSYDDMYALKMRLGLSPLIGQFSELGVNLDLGVKYERGKEPRVSLLFNMGY